MNRPYYCARCDAPIVDDKNFLNGRCVCGETKVRLLPKKYAATALGGHRVGKGDAAAAAIPCVGGREPHAVHGGPAAEIVDGRFSLRGAR